jgi:arylsulfatase A-like enzyme
MKYLNILILIFSISVSSKPNVIIILTDDLGWGDVSYHGSHIPTPNMDALASNGLELNRFYANPVCSPTRASLLTGLHIFNHGVVRPFQNPTAEQFGLSPDLKIMPQYFKEAGYQTALSGKWHLGMHDEAFWPTNRGFDTSYGHMLGGIGYFDHVAAKRMDWHRNEEPLIEEGYSTTLIADEAVRIIENKDHDRPLFLYVAFNAPHTPIQAPTSNIESFSHIEDPLIRAYAANVNALDTEIGKIIQSIEDQGLLEETIIVFFSDNGPVVDVNPIIATLAPGLTKSKGNTAGLKGSKTSALEGGVRVPASIWWQGVIENSVTDQFMFVQDLLPTLLTAAGIKVDESIDFDGSDKWENLLNDKITPPDNDFVGAQIVFDERALYKDEWKLHLRKPVMFPGSKGTYTLFNIIDDPFESNDLSKIELKVFDDMTTYMQNIDETKSMPLINPAHTYFYGDSEGGEVIGRPWLDRDYEISEYPSPVASFFIMLWVIILSFKYYLLAFLIAISLTIYAIKKIRTAR